MISSPHDKILLVAFVVAVTKIPDRNPLRLEIQFLTQTFKKISVYHYRESWGGMGSTSPTVVGIGEREMD